MHKLKIPSQTSMLKNEGDMKRIITDSGGFHTAVLIAAEASHFFQRQLKQPVH